MEADLTAPPDLRRPTYICAAFRRERRPDHRVTPGAARQLDSATLTGRIPVERHDVLVLSWDARLRIQGSGCPAL